MSTLLARFRELLGAQHVLTGDEAQPFLTDWRHLCTGQALAVLRPADTTQVAAIVRLCAREHVAVVPQGGNTGQVAAATPDDSGKAVVISLMRMSRVRGIDTDNDTITVEAGCILRHVQDAAAAADRLFPLSLGAEGSCAIGGNLATNAGGTQVLRYGNARDLTLGLEVVTSDGGIWHGLHGLRKNNTGYDLRDLYIGSEGTLGIITAATLKLFPRPKMQRTAFLALKNLQDAICILRSARECLGASLTGFEVMSEACMNLVIDTDTKQRLPFHAAPVGTLWYALIETSDSQNDSLFGDRFEAFLGDEIGKQHILDAAIASSQMQSEAFWTLRESITLALATSGYCIKHDISLSISTIPEFVQATNAAIEVQYPGARLMVFGHLGDGNLHYNVLGPVEAEREQVAVKETEIQSLVHDAVVSVGGSISAEQGIGSRRVSDLARYKSTIEMDLMRRIKNALDPLNIMNPGKILDSSFLLSSRK